MKVGYMRVSRREQNPDLQRRALEAAGCERLFGEKASGANAEREELVAALDTSGRATSSWCGSSIGSDAPSRT